MVLPTGQTRHCGSVPYLRGRSTQSASLLNSPQSGTFHYLSTFLHIHRIGLHRGEKGWQQERCRENKGEGLRRVGITRAGQEVEGMLVRDKVEERGK